MDLSLLNVKIETQVPVAIVTAYCMSLDAGITCAMCMQILLKY